MSQLEDLQGLGPRSSAWLHDAGIDSADELRRVGATVAYSRVVQSGAPATRNLLWALHGAIEGKPWTAVTPEEKRRLERELAALVG